VFDVSEKKMAGGLIDESTRATRGAMAQNSNGFGPSDWNAGAGAGAPTPGSAGTTA
jgi:hypothetical protein